MLDNENEGTRSLLRKSTTAAAPAGLEDRAVGQAFIPGSTARAIVSEAGKMTEQPGVKVVWFLKNTYFLIPLLGLWLFGKIYRLKAAG